MNESEVKDVSILANYPRVPYISLAGKALRKAPWLRAMIEGLEIDLHGNSIKILPEFEAPSKSDPLQFAAQQNPQRSHPPLPNSDRD
jgi:hypothetical protein